MRIATQLLAGAAFCAALAFVTTHPAAAEVTQIGSVNVAADKFTDVTWTRFEGPVQMLALSPVADTVDCAHINVVYKDGIVRKVFEGTMEKDSIKTIAILGSDANVAALEFACKARQVDGARIALSSLQDGDALTPPGNWTQPASVTAHNGP